MQKLRKILIFIVGLSIPFNNVGLTFAGKSWSLGLIASVFYLFSMLPELSRIPSIFKFYGKFIFSIFIFASILTIINILNVNDYGTPVIPTTLFLCCLLFYVMLLHDKIDRGVLQIALYGLVLGCVLMSLFFFLGIGLEIGEDSRLMMFGENSNELGIYMCIAIVTILNNWILSKTIRLRYLKIFAILILLSLFLLLFATGSRVAFISCVLAIFLWLIFLKTRHTISKIFIWVFALFALFLVYKYLQNSHSVVLERILTTIEDGNLSGRDEIFGDLWPYVIDNLFSGVGQTGYVDVAKASIGKVSVIGGITYGFSPHNVILEVLIYTGILGLLFWSVFWGRCVKLSIQTYQRKKNLLPLLFLIPVLCCVLSAQILTSKWAYLLYAYIISEGINNKLVSKRS